ncbi:MAG: outer membrane beta-barrel protein [Proteobacteria bacterium]|nr:outer membrane beta-barrel protein [Pseudomonadota bacterium]
MKSKILWLSFLLLCIPFQAFAAGNIHLGLLEIHPYTLLQETYNDNIFAAATDTKNDWITTITPGIKLLLPTGMHQFALEYNAVINRYADFSSENTTDHNASINADLKLGSLIGLRLNDTYAHGHEPRASSTSGQIEKYDTNAASFSATYQLADTSKVQLDYTRTTWDFQLGDDRDRKEDLFSIYLYYRFFPKVSAFVEADYIKADYDLETSVLNNTVNSGYLGLKWEVSPYTKGTVKGGYFNKDFDTEGQDGINGFSGAIDIDHEFSDYSSLKVVGKRVIHDSPNQAARYYITTGAYVEYKHKFIFNISGVVRGSYGTDDYSDPIAPETLTRSDRTILGGVGLKYQMRDWLEFALDYNRLDRDSNIEAHDFISNTYALTINLAL